MKIRLAGPLQADSIVDGEGIRTVIWTQGCLHHCPGCHNPQTHDPNGGYEVDLDDIKESIDNLTSQDGITLSGGDPFFQSEACSIIAKYAHKKKLNVWCYTGYRYEELLRLSKKDENILKLLENIDVLIDGRFILHEKSMEVLFRGSKNQRIIDVKKSLKEDKIVEIEKYKYKPQEEKITKREVYI